MAEKDKYYKNAAAQDTEARDILNSSRMAEPDKRAKVKSILSDRTKAFEARRKKSEEEDVARKASIKEKLTYITDTQVKDTPEEVSKITSFLTEEAGRNKLPDPYSQESIDQEGSLTDPNFQTGVVSDSPAIREDRGDQSVFDKKSTMRQDFFKEMKSLSSGALDGKGNLTPEMYAKAKEQLGKYEGVSGEAFESTMKKNSINTSNFTTAAPTSSPKEAAQNVMFQREHGTGLGALAAMQDPNYKIGSGSPLLKPPSAIGPKSGKARRASRRLRRQGYGKAAEQMAMAGEVAQLGESSINTPALKAGRLLGKIDASNEVKKQEEERKKQAEIADARGVKEPKSNDSIEQPKKVGEYQSPLDKKRNQNPEKPKASGTFLYDKEGNAISLDEVRRRAQGPVYYDKDGNEMMISEYQTAELRDSNGNGIGDRSEGIYRESDYVIKPKGQRPKGL